MDEVIRFLPIPYAAIEATDLAEHGAVIDLYRRAHARRWRSFKITERSLATKWGVSARRVWSILERLEDDDLLTICKGSKRKQTVLCLRCPTNEKAKHSGQHSGQQNEADRKHDMRDREAQDEAQGEAPSLRDEKRQREKEQAAADFVVALAIYNDHVRSSFDQPMSPTKLKPSKGQGLHLAQLIKAEGLDDVIEVFQWWSTAQDQGLRGGAAFHRAERSTIETMRRRFDGYLDKARNPYKASANGSSNGSGSMKAEAAAVLGKINVMIRDPRWNPADLGDSEHAEAARAGLAACGGIDDFRRSRDEIGDRIRFVAGYLERRSNP